MDASSFRETVFRPLDEQFERPAAERIKSLIDTIDTLGAMDGPERYFGYELQQCLRAGLLLAALHVACSLLELRVRHLALAISAGTSNDKQPRLSVLQRQLEQDRKQRFKALVDS